LLITLIRLTVKFHFVFSTKMTRPGTEMLSMSVPQRSKPISRFHYAGE